jgi:hypothetical protein
MNRKIVFFNSLIRLIYGCKLSIKLIFHLQMAIRRRIIKLHTKAAHENVSTLTTLQYQNQVNKSKLKYLMTRKLSVLLCVVFLCARLLSRFHCPARISPFNILIIKRERIIPKLCSATAFLFLQQLIERFSGRIITIYTLNCTHAINCKLIALSRNCLSILKRLRITMPW